MVNARRLPTALAALSALLLGPVVVAQTLPFAPVLESDAVQVMAAQWSPGTARRTIAPRMASELYWSATRAQALLDAIPAVAMEGLDPADYRPDALRAAIAAGEGPELDRVATAIFTWLVEDYRDGRTPVSARRAYLMEDSDSAQIEAGAVMQRALASGDIRGALNSLLPSSPDYSALRAHLSITPLSETDKRNRIRANMDRWRWLPRDLGGIHLIVNVPEYMLRLNVNGEVLRTYRTIVGQPGRNATPQMVEMVEGVIFNPNWTVPQSIVVGEGLGRRVLDNPAWARTMGYTATRGANGFVSVVQAPGPRNALGMMKLDMPNAHAIFLHDTPNRNLFANANRALSHGCVRVEDAMELAVTISLLGEGASSEEAMRISESGTYTRVPLARQVPVFLTYFTMRVDENGQLVEYADIYSRDAPVLAALARPSGRQL
ncbi:L,D-transpeptidase family protein [Altererythrobacter sp. KTW20L]|uniref:L,D-transpeptidase family protein n=1 Tax=Altererythrobacter sp. KTW20L TaxID=2942210 RepID=UPI0020BF3691|nr:L,D-transpeptidase family protein [Altererythrobacter sp. KTW20L]MCL6251412.1 L,D-transpeptidase family protein [Altererythrobacter sp. KTW20L]